MQAGMKCFIRNSFNMSQTFAQDFCLLDVYSKSYRVRLAENSGDKQETKLRKTEQTPQTQITSSFQHHPELFFSTLAYFLQFFKMPYYAR